MTVYPTYRPRLRNDCRIQVYVAWFFVLCLPTACVAQTRNAINSEPIPILVELFTSEGCSSCPPVDAFIQTLDTSQPVPKAQLIVLSEHVDYFNHEGWADPYSSRFVTDRQFDYARVLRLGNPYTPQVIVDGNAVLHLDHPEQVKQVFQNASAAPMIPIHLQTATDNAQHPNDLTTHVVIDRGPDRHDAGIYLAIALDHVDSHVLGGENGGRSLTHVAVLESLTKIGELTHESDFNKDIHVKLKHESKAQKLRVIVFLQENGPGRVLGAAMTKVVY